MNINGIKSNNNFTAQKNKDNSLNFKRIEKKLNLPDDKDERYNKLIAMGGILGLCCIGVALICQTTFLGSYKRKPFLNKFIKLFSPKKDPAPRECRPYPEVNFAKDGNRAIHKAWTDFKKNIENNIKKHDKIHNIYEKLFAKEAEKLNDLEKVAREKVLSRGKEWY